MKARITIIFLLLAIGFTQTALAQYEQKSFDAVRTDESIKIDGVIDEDIWCTVPVQTNFTQLRPNPGEAGAKRTEVRMVYDDDAIYISAVLYDKKEDIFNLLTNRDNIGNSDYFGVIIDPFKAGLNGVGLFVTVAGVQYDTRYSNGGNERIWRNDESWNAAWLSETKIYEDRWVVEYKIPYAVLRFDGKEVQDWGINFFRRSTSDNQDLHWNAIDPELDGFLNQAGVVKNLTNIETPTRLFFYPYVSTVVTRSTEQGFVKPQFNAGMDLKYGINDAFTLDMTLIPDFSGVRSDNQVLNLSPFEVRFNENRQFFTEGVELFSKAGLFYSRRIGGTFGHRPEDPTDREEVIITPQAAQLLNASKVTGRTSKGLGIGLFNAITDGTVITVQDTLTGELRDLEADPMTNFNVIVLDQNLKNNSSISLTNTNVSRWKKGDDANVSGLNLSLRDKSLTWRFRGAYSYSHIRYYSDDDRNVKDGFSYDLDFAKTRGNFQFNVRRNVDSRDYDINDLGFLRRANSIEHGANVSYNSFQPKGIFNNWNVRTGAEYSELFDPKTYTNFRVNLNADGQFRNFWSVGGFIRVDPRTNYDYFEPRTDGYYFKRDPSHSYGTNYSTDGRKNFRTNGRISFWERPSWEQTEFGFNHSERLRVGARFEISHRVNFTDKNNERGYVTKLYDDQDNLEDIIFGKRRVKNLENTLDSRYIFTNRMGLTFRMRHYWSRVDYKDYLKLQEDGELTDSDYTGMDGGESLHDRNYNAFNIDMEYNWQLAPGSEFKIIWKRQIYTDGNMPEVTFVDNFEDTWNAPNVDTFTFRLVYFVDYLNIKKIFQSS
ncbi:DUF5916 domain-containing protein [Roseivirga pacifica]|uniref:DUF5916 domain-containing protein n=1 Tax=Roseivirga pacifica TaxID=1267423 RepID=UPI001113DCA7|nr:DUF5916 domain-containing protein [Roseivirga pacifica]